MTPWPMANESVLPLIGSVPRKGGGGSESFQDGGHVAVWEDRCALPHTWPSASHRLAVPELYPVLSTSDLVSNMLPRAL